MSTTYDYRVHTHILIEKATFDNRPLEIVHAPKGRVWVWLSYADKLPPEAVRVGDGLNDGYDEEGNFLVSLPIDMDDTMFLTDEDVESLWAMMDADAFLLACAR
jgi:hypothetical protein